MITKKKLRKVSDYVFEEIDEEWEKEGRKPLEWRKHWQTVHLPLTNAEIATACTVQTYSLDHFGLGTSEEPRPPFKQLESKVENATLIKGIVDGDQLRDRFFYAIEEDRENDIYSIQPAPGQIIVWLRSGDPTEETEDFPAGLYIGSAFHLDFEPGDDDLFMEMTLPQDQLLSLTAALKADENSILEVVVNLHAYTFEVDDALREPYHPQAFLLRNSSAACFVKYAEVTSKAGLQQPPQENGDGDEDDYMQEDVEPQLTPEQILNQNLAQGLNLLSKPLQGLSVAVWVLVILVALNLVL